MGIGFGIGPKPKYVFKSPHGRPHYIRKIKKVFISKSWFKKKKVDFNVLGLSIHAVGVIFGFKVVFKKSLSTYCDYLGFGS